MSLATRCTRCGTIFKVVEDQLKVSEGWVRCGRCQEVFHAVPNLFDLEKDPPPPRSAEARAFAPSGFGDLDNPPSQPSEWPATQPQTQPGELDARPPATSQPDEPVALPSTVPASLASPAPHGVEAAHTAAAPAVAPDNAPAAGPKVGPQPAPPQTRSWLAPVPATTDFDLDTQVKASASQPTAPGGAAPMAPLTPGLDDIELDTAVPLSPRAQPLHDDRPAPLDEPLSLRLSPMGSHEADDGSEHATSSVAPDWASPSRIDLVPSTEESDALDSRYLLPSARRERPAARRPSDAPDFADAEFPSDWLLDAEEDERAARAAAEAEAARQVALQAEHQAQQQAAQEAARAAALAASRLMGKAEAPTPPALQAQPADERDGTTVPSQFLDELDGLAAPQAPAETPLESEQAQPKGLSALRRKKAKPEAPPGFVKQAQAQARWRHPAVRAVLALMTVGLLLTLTLQVVHQFRDLIAAHHPPLKPYLAQWCEQMGCEIKAPLRIEDLQVDSLTFVRATSEGPDTYRLTVVLHNKAPIDLAWPAIDLSLTDTTGALLIRRVFSPQDANWQDSAEPVAQAGGRPPAAAPAQRSTTLQWRLKIAQLQPAGYTADIFYP
jgi:predicted Zn finger-like uncharacterized protein